MIDSKPALSHSRFKRKVEPSSDEGASGKRRHQQTNSPNVASASRKTVDASKVKNLSKAKFQKECKKEEVVEEEEEEDDDDEEEEEEQAVSVADMFSSQFGKEENDYGEYDSG